MNAEHNEEKMTKNFISILKGLSDVKFSFLALYLISLALHYKYAYFAAFNINITSFISISDLSVFFIDLLPQLVYFFFLIGLICLLFIAISVIFEKISLKFRKDKKGLEKDVDKNEQKKPPIPLILFSLYAPFYIFYTSVTTYAFPFSLVPDPYLSIYDSSLLVLRIFSVFMIIAFFFIHIVFLPTIIPLLKKVKLSVKRFKLILFGLTIFYLTGIFGTLHAGFKMTFLVNPVIEFAYENKKISSLDDNIVHVGNTNEYIFMYYKDLAITKSYRVSKIDNVSFFHDIIKEHQEYMKKRKTFIENSKRNNKD